MSINDGILYINPMKDNPSNINDSFQMELGFIAMITVYDKSDR